jgi:hypothetical protein
MSVTSLLLSLDLATAFLQVPQTVLQISTMTLKSSLNLVIVMQALPDFTTSFYTIAHFSTSNGLPPVVR